jgi:hypothetical protein
MYFELIDQIKLEYFIVRKSESDNDQIDFYINHVKNNDQIERHLPLLHLTIDQLFEVDFPHIHFIFIETSNLSVNILNLFQGIDS